MQRKRLNNTELELSPLGLGTTGFGSTITVAEAEAQMDAFLAAGGNLIDTAQVYGFAVTGAPGYSETVIGDWLRKRGGRDKLHLSTKGAHPPRANMAQSRCTPAEIESDLAASLQNLATDYIDLYYLHRDDESMPVETILDCLEKAVKAGKIRYYACSNWSVARIREAQAYAASIGGTGFVCNQLMWSLADINWSGVDDKTLFLMDAETHAYHTETGLAAMAYTSSAKGYFSKRAAGVDLSGLNATYQNDSNDRIFALLQKLSAESGLTVNQLSLLYIICQPFPSMALASFSNEAQMRESFALLENEYDPELVRELAAAKQFVYGSKQG